MTHPQPGRPDPDGETEDQSGEQAEDQTTENSEQELSPLAVRGTPLTADELAAVTALMGRLAVADPVTAHDAGSTGPADRTLQRRRRLGLWGRPGPDSWKHAAGLK